MDAPATPTRSLAPSATPSLGGCDFLEDPALDARIAEPVWHPEPDPLVALAPAVNEDAEPFSLWAIPGPKTLVHDGRRLLMRTTLGRRVVRLAVALTLDHGSPFAYAVPAGPRSRRAMQAAAELDAALGAAPLDSRASAVPRTAIVHMRSLQALDAERDGASEREIAALVFGTIDEGEVWNDSALRANVRYLLDHGRALRDGGYCDLIHPKPPRRKAAKP